MEPSCQLSNFYQKTIVDYHINFSNYFYFYRKTGLCQHKHRELVVAIMKAKDYGLIKFDVPSREYEYSDYQKS
jgi:small subunit ribosomal protein S18b